MSAVTHGRTVRVCMFEVFLYVYEYVIGGQGMGHNSWVMSDIWMSTLVCVCLSVGVMDTHMGWLRSVGSRIDKIIGLVCRISSLLWGSFAKETHTLIDPANQSHTIQRRLITDLCWYMYLCLCLCCCRCVCVSNLITCVNWCYVCVCVYIYIFICTSELMYTSTYVCACVHICISMCVCVGGCACLCVCVRACMYVCSHARICVRAHAVAYVCVCSRARA